MATATAAATLPSLLAYNVSPSPTFYNQALAFALWAAFVIVSLPERKLAAPNALWAAFVILCATAAWSALAGALPSPLALSALATLLAGGLMVVAGQSARPLAQRESLFAAFAWAWLVAGVFNVLIAAIQVFAPDLCDGNWIAASGIPGRAVGSLRQPNHLSSMLLWSCIAGVALVELRQLPARWAGVALAAFVWAVVLSASRTGGVSVVLLALWGLLDRRLSRPSRTLLALTPLVYGLAWWGMVEWAAGSEHLFGGAARLAEKDLSGSRFGIWKNTLALIQAQPWTGVGFGEFNLAWTLTPFPGRPTAFFDHTHNLPLQLAVEIGLPLAALVMGLLLWALGRAALAAWRAEGDAGTAQRCAVLMVLMFGLHSLLEYPLWYSYFLLPTAWAFGFALRDPAAGADSAVAPARAPLAWAAWAVVAGALLSVWDYGRVAAIFSAGPGAPPLEERIARGQSSIFFAHHADYAAVTSGVAAADPAHAFDRTVHYLMDTRLMMAWARALAERGELDAARHLAARLREFDKADAEDFFDACPDAASTPAAGLAFQCELPTRALDWRDFLPQRR